MAGGEEAEEPEYWLRWQVPACAAILAVPAAVSVAVISRSRAVDPPRSSDLWSPCWKKLSPLWLLGLRALALSILFWLLCRAVLLDGAFAFYFYTQWTLSLVIIYFLIGTFISAHGCWIYAKRATENDEADTFFNRDFGEELPATSTGSNRNTKSSKFHNVYEWVDNEQKAGFWGYLMQIAYQTSAGAVTLTDMVFWGLLVPFLSAEHFKPDMLMGCMHTLNLVFLLLDTALNSLPFPWFRMAYFVLWSCVYVIFQWILHICGFSWYLCLALVHIPCYGLYSLIVKAKISLIPKIFHRIYIRP